MRDKARLGQIDDFINSMDAANDHKSVFQILRQHVERLGFQYYSYELMIPPKGYGALYSNSYPSEWISYYIQNGYSSDDIICRYTAQNIRPFKWTDLTQRQQITKQQLRVLNEGKDAGVRAGASIPIYGPSGEKAYLVVACDTSDEEFSKIFIRSQHEVHLMATYTHERILKIGLPDMLPTKSMLGPREIEILKWTARGKSAWEISSILSLSEDTVKEYIKRVCKKLDVSNKIHAVAISMSQGIVVL